MKRFFVTLAHQLALVAALVYASPADALSILRNSGPGVGIAAGGGGGGGQTIVAVSISNSTFVSDTPSGTAIGTISVTMSPGPGFSGTLALSTSIGGCNGTNGANNASWSVSGTMLQSASGSLSSNQSVCVLASQGGSVFGLPLTLTAAHSGYFISSCTTSLVGCPGQTTLASDSNAGTLAAPVASMTKLQTLQQGGPAYGYFRNGAYAPNAFSPDCADGSCAVQLTATDDNETWSYYPPDGYDSAVITGGATSPTSGLGEIFSCAGATGVTVNGLYMEDVRYSDLNSAGDLNAEGAALCSGWLIENNMGTGSTSQAEYNEGMFINFTGCSGCTITHNVIWNMQSRGTTVYGCRYADGCMTNLTVSYNHIFKTCEDDDDCGGIYDEDITCANQSGSSCPNVGTSTNIQILYNLVRDAGLTSGGDWQGLYADACMKNVTWSGNVIYGEETSGFLTGSGQEFTITGNIFDFGAYSPAILSFTTTTHNNTTNGCLNSATAGTITASNNITITRSNTGGGYDYQNTQIGASASISDSDYYAYSGTTPSHAGANGYTGDTSPVNVNPSFLPNRCFALPSDSPVYADISFPTQPSNWDTPGFWGPPGYSPSQNPATGSSEPSYPSPSC